MAEALITLAIIGVVAAMTIPTLIQKHQEKVTVTKLKKFYSVVSQAYQMAEQEYGDPTNWDLTDGKSLAEKFEPYLKVTNGHFRPNATGGNSTDYYYAVDGTIIAFSLWSPDCLTKRGSGHLAQSCGAVYTRFAKLEKDNIVGITDFAFEITKTGGIIPFGSKDETANPFQTKCINTTGRLGCTAWVIINENMEYLRCDDLQWNGKTKCD